MNQFVLPATCLALLLSISTTLTAQVPMVGDIGEPAFESGASPITKPLATPPVSGQSILFQHGDPTVYEQHLLELVNRARADPGAEAMRFGIDLNQGLPPGTIEDTPRQPLAFHPALIESARAHSQWMLDNDIFDHTGVGGSTPGDRMGAAGYPFSGSWTWGENIGWKGTSGAFSPTEYTEALHENWILSAGHRQNLMKADFDEFGTGLLEGVFSGWNALMGTENFARSGGTPGPLLTGVVYQDLDNDGFYDPNEGLGGVEVYAGSGDYYTLTSAAGGYALPYSGSGPLQASFSGGPLADTQTRSFTASGQNVKLDLRVSEIPDVYSLSVSLGGPGSLSSSPAGIHCPGTCIASFQAGAAITLTPTPDTNARFTGWGGDCAGTASTCTLVMTRARTVAANFATQDTMDRSGADWQVTEIYIATLGYAPDHEGLQYWVDNIETRPAWTPTTVAQSFFDQPLVQERYPAGQSYESLIEALYQNIFGRPADATGKVYWLGQLESGAIQRNQMIIALINGGWANPDAALDMQRFGHRIQVGLAFAAEQEARGIRYSLLPASDQAALRALGVEVIADVTADPATREAAIASLPGLFDMRLACVDQCRLGEVDGAASCQLWEATTGLWNDTPDDGAGQLHNRARYHTAWLNHWMRPVGGVMAAEFTDETLSAIRSYGARRDSPIWTGSYLAAEALRLMSTGAPDAERALRETVATLHRWWSISGDRGYLARYAAPADSPEPVLALLRADDPEVHRDVPYENRLWHWRGNISRDQYQGVIFGYSLAYEAIQDPTLRAIIREDVVRFIEQLMDSENQPVRARIQGTTISQNIRVPYAVFSRADAPGGTPTLTLRLTPFEGTGEGVLFFSPNAAELVRQLPGFGSFPDVYQSTEAIQLGAMFNVALQVTEGVPEYAERRRAIAEHYARQADSWLDIATRWRNTNRCDSGYFGLNIGFMPLYTWTRLESDPARRDRLQRTVLRDALWAEVADHKNVFFAFIYASQAADEDDIRPVIDAHVAQLTRFSSAPNLSRPVNLHDSYPESTSCPGISAEAVNVDERPATTFTWERHPWKLQDAGTPNMAYGGVDYLVAYWMGRYHGFIADDAPGTCLLWTH